jgi:heat shock protein HslJ
MRRTLLALPLLACMPTVAETPWQLAQIGGEPVPAALAVTLEFPEPASIAGQAPCNRYFGAYAGTLPDFRPAGIGSTEMACDALALEVRFFAALGAATRAQADAGRLTVTGTGETLVFTRPAN